jgi:hypothetical protein
MEKTNEEKRESRQIRHLKRAHNYAEVPNRQTGKVLVHYLKNHGYKATVEKTHHGNYPFFVNVTSRYRKK